MNISLLDIWYFLINFNLLGLIPILVAGFLAAIFAFDFTDDYFDDVKYKESSILFFQVVLFVFYFSFNYSIIFLILDIWLNWIDMLYPQIIVDTFNELEDWFEK